jgi:hypothetical protein
VSHFKGKTFFVIVSRVSGGQKGSCSVRSVPVRMIFSAKWLRWWLEPPSRRKFPTTAAFQPSAVTSAVEGLQAFQGLSQTKRLGASVLSNQSFAMTVGLVSAFPKPQK